MPPRTLARVALPLLLAAALLLPAVAGMIVDDEDVSAHPAAPQTQTALRVIASR
ncbi:MAG TPA: hypothetical protein VK324_05980 [Tepidisphaeraceae bacterium]|nr:hypothetical protein [Tepidisphaeraceae bacterium]